MFSSGGAFGSGGGSGTSNNSSGFGGFGQPAQSKPTGFGSGTGAFGSTQAGGGGFGSGSGIGGFGGTSTGGGGFGSSASAFGGGASAPTGAFGSTGGGFGGGGGFGQPQQQQQPASGAGAASSLFGGGAFGSSAAGGFGAGATGTARAAFEPVVDVSTTGKKDSFRHICFMNAYKAFSPEELRLEDYEAGRKKADAPAAAPGARTGFGAGATGGFGSTAAGGGFGQTAATGAFGSSSTGGFGQSAGSFGSTGGFGQQPASASVGGGFGLNKPATAAPAIGGFGSTGTGGFSGGFGQPAAAATGSIFGASKPSAFGATTAAPATGGFGSSASGFGSASTGGFGSTGGGFGGGGGFGQAASTGGFGQTSTAAPAATGAFGSSGGAFGAKPAFGATTGFGSSAAAQPAAGLGFGQPSTGGFGQSTTGGFGQPAATGGFGQTAGATGAAGGGLFGQTANAAGSTGGGLFGAKPAATGGLFGQSTAAPAAGGGGGLFGQQSTAAPATGGGLFGQTAPAATGGGLFGSTSGGASTGGGLFGAKPAAPATGGLFGSAPAAGTQAGAATGGGGLFGSGGGGLFGSNTATAAGATGTGGGLFGSAAAAPATGGTGLFGSTAGTGGGGGLFGSSATTAAPGASTSLFGFGGQPAQQQPAQQTSLFGAPAQSALQPLQQQQQQQLQQLSAQIDRQPYGASSLFDTTRLAGARANTTGSSHLTSTPLRAVPASDQAAGGGKDADRDLQLLKKRGLSLHTLLASPHVGSGSSASGAGMNRLRARGFAAPNTVKKLVPTSSSLSTGSFLSPEKQAPHSSVKRLVPSQKLGSGFSGVVSSAKATPAAAAAAAPLSFGDMLGSPPQMGNPWADSPQKPSTLSNAGRTPAASRRTAASVAAELAAAGGEAEDEAESAFASPPVTRHLDDDTVAEQSDVEEEDEEDDDDDGSGIKQGDYWMTPSLTALRTLKPQQLRAVKDFIVGRKGVGQVHFSRPVDLTTVGSLAAIAGGVVLFDDRVCTVYPDESNKPPRGQGLNVPATISLNNCWPVDRATGEPITRLDDPRVRKHTKRLRSIAETQFKDFSEGKWTFGVEHFSRYGLDDNQASSDGEDEEDVASDAKALDFVNATAQQAPVTAQQSLLDEGSRAVADVPLSSTVDDSLNVHKRLPRQLLLGARHAESLRRAPVMRASLFASSSDDSSSQQQQPPPEPAAASFGRIQTMSPAVPVALPQSKQPAANGARNQPRRRDNESQATVATEASIAALDLPPPSKFLRINETRIARELLSAPQPYAQSLTHGRSGLGADAGLMMARSFRVAFGFQGQLVYLQGSSRRMDDDDDDSASSKRGRGASSVVVVDSIARHLHAAPGCLEPLAVAGGDDDVERIRQRHLDTVSAQYRHAAIAPAEADSCPAVSFSADTTIASVLSDLSSATTDGSSQHQQLGEEERRILSLASVLFDEPANAVGDDEDPIARQRVQAVRRRQALTKWMMSAVHDSVQRDLVRASESPSPAAAAVFALLSGHRIEAACLAATSHRDYRLAMLVAQCGAGAVGGGGNDAHMQALARVQLERIGEDPCLAPAYRRVYELIGGRVVNASAAIDWKRAFALGLWFAQSPADRIADAVSMYENAVAEPLTRLAPPLPAWLFQGSEECKRLSVLPVSDIGTTNSKGNVGVVRAAARAADLHRRGVCDPVFQLLKLFSEPAYPLERALLSESFSAARGDSRLSALLAWLLAAIRQCRGFEDAKPSSSSGVVDSLAYDRLLAGWALQLESLGLWHWACFVLLQLSSSATHKAHAIRALLDRSMPTSLPTAALSPEGELLSLCGAGQSLDIVDDRIEEQLRFVLEDLRLPRQWLFEAMATRSRYDRDWLDVRSYGAFIDVEVEEHPVLVAARRQFTASGRPIVQSFFGQFASSQQRQQPISARVGMPTDSRAAATLRHVVWLLSAQQLSAAHAVVLQSIAPDAILCGDYQLLSRVLGYLDPTTVAMPSSAKVVPFEEWATGGRVYQAFLAAVNDLPTVLQCIASAATMASMELMQELQRIYHDMRALLAALPTLAARFGEAPSSGGGAMGFAATAGDGEVCWYSAEEARVLCVKYSVTVSDMASVISGFVQKLESHAAGLATMEEVPVACAGTDSAAALPLAQDVRILRTLQMARTCFDSLVGSELEA
ncbi:hypothetical protein IWW39_001788 [Coemansia spiralis]|uniref:Peptidase S59 domain-containing protein n=1 Tax=Coemansia spiralis TaxID=417178 RepID=A0A9W8L5V2_9FUNG|nr:hypothetical protein IWW39_001788 [Coemansia spiralis]